MEVDKVLETVYKDREKCETIYRLIPDTNGELPSLKMENCFVNLMVVKHIDPEVNGCGSGHLDQPSKDKDEYGDVNQTFNRPRSSEELNFEEAGTKAIFQIEDLFEITELSGISRRIFMLGRAGIGKTTLCKKIVYEYYIHGLWKNKFDRIIWLPLRIFKGKSISELNSPNLLDIFALHYFTDIEGVESKVLAKELVDENNKNEQKVLYLLDGLDEIQNLVANGNSEVSKIIDELFKKPFVVVTSRPYTFHDSYAHFDFILETIGFSEENVFDYIRVVFDDPSDFQTQKEIIEFVEKSPGNISGIVSIPILLDIICYTWAEIRVLESKVPITMTRLYSVLEKYLWGKFLMRTNNIDPEDWRNTIKHKSEIYSLVSKTINVYLLPKVAYKMLAQNRIEFSSAEAMYQSQEDFGHKERILMKNTNFLHCLNPVEEKIEEIFKSYVFIHLTVQEYLAAVYIAHCLKQNQREFDIAIFHKYNPRYSIVWSFVSGILADSQEEFGYLDNGLLLETFFNYLERDPTDLLGIAHQHLIVSCLNECSYPSILDSERENRLINELLSYIFTQYVAGGKSLFEQQLPIKLLKKLIGIPDEWWERDSANFIITVFREQRLPEEIVTIILNDIDAARPNLLSKDNEKILRRQSHFGRMAIKAVTERLNSKIKANQTEKALKYFDILATKKYYLVTRNPSII